MKIVCTYHFLKKNVEWNYDNGIAKMGGKKNLQLVCGNVIAEIGGKKKIFGQLWQSHCRKWEGKKKKKAVSEIQLM